MISVVIPLYNKENDVRRTLESVLNQSYTDFEVVVVDDGSTDGSANIVQEMMSSDARIRLIKQQNAGVSAARNKGIREAKNDLVALIDADDFWDKECLLELFKMTVDFPDAALWGVNYTGLRYGEYKPFNQEMPEGFRDYVKDYFGTPNGGLFCSSSVILHREKAMAVGLFDERIRIAEDIDLWYRIILNYPVAFYNKVLSCYNRDAANRAEGILGFHHEITKRIDYYIEKFEPYFSKNKAFARSFSMRIAYDILHFGYYFGNRHERECTNHIVRHIPYDEMPSKYRLIFKTPRPIGWCVYRLSLLKKRIFNKK